MTAPLTLFLRGGAPRPNPPYSDAASSLMDGGPVLEIFWDTLQSAWLWSVHSGGRKRAGGVMRFHPNRTELIDGREMPLYLRSNEGRDAMRYAREEAAAHGFARGTYREVERTSKFY